MKHGTMHKTQIIVWQALSWQSTVVHTHMVNDGIHGHGFAVGKTDNNIPFAIEYEITLTEDWNVKEMSIRSLLDERVIRLMHEGKKWYNDKGQHVSEFDGVELVDISISPFTNTLPIRHLQFEGNQLHKVEIIYFNENSFSLQRVQQIYSQVDEQTYRYQDLVIPDFVSDITVDDEGFVIDFQKMFRRV